MKTVGFQPKLCKPRHSFTKGKVECLVRFIKENFHFGRIFWKDLLENYRFESSCSELVQPA